MNLLKSTKSVDLLHFIILCEVDFSTFFFVPKLFPMFFILWNELPKTYLLNLSEILKTNNKTKLKCVSFSRGKSLQTFIVSKQLMDVVDLVYSV